MKVVYTAKHNLHTTNPTLFNQRFMLKPLEFITRQISKSAELTLYINVDEYKTVTGRENRIFHIVR